MQLSGINLTSDIDFVVVKYAIFFLFFSTLERECILYNVRTYKYDLLYYFYVELNAVQFDVHSSTTYFVHRTTWILLTCID